MTKQDYYIKQDSILRTILSITPKGNFFNSENHLINTISTYLGYSPSNTRKIVDGYKKENLLVFENQQVKWSLSENLDSIKIPNYILFTQKIKDKAYWLRLREYEILCYLSNKRNALHYLFENEEIKNASEILYICTETIAREIGYTEDQVRTSLKKINLYFQDFWISSSKEDRKKRRHKYSISKTINLPNRKEWKSIIESKILNMTELNSSDMILPILIDEGKKKKFDKGKKMYSLVEYSKILTHNKKQAARLKEGMEKIQKIKICFNMACNFDNLGDKVKQEIEKIIEKIVFNKKDPFKVLSMIRKLETDFPFLN